MKELNLILYSVGFSGIFSIPLVADTGLAILGFVSAIAARIIDKCFL